MKLKEVAQLVEAEFLNLPEKADEEVHTACAADLLSDVLAMRGEAALLITGEAAPQVVRVADVMNIRAILYVRGKKPQKKDIVKWATQRGIVLLSTPLPTFEACGRLYVKGMRCSECSEIEFA
ncbi:MAG: hypothetical protein DRI93_04460 [Aquificota bacterium]|nr:MAG: hypothetical protein DRI93_04460 [Aquificota bacterium]RLD97793.1 MAG: hypothetical protein DRI91_04530 [Aquificota bacterium]